MAAYCPRGAGKERKGGPPPGQAGSERPLLGNPRKFLPDRRAELRLFICSFGRRDFAPERLPGRRAGGRCNLPLGEGLPGGVVGFFPSGRGAHGVLGLLVRAQDKEKKKKESILDLSKYIDKTIRVKFQGGREASGVLKGFDPLLNLVLDGTIEYMRDPDDQYKLTEDTRQLGLVVCRGTSVVLICPQDGMEAIPNPFIQQQDG
ncbi:U6 snRNA-associated Sm-like protein LSm7 [Python bivittatus]|uniref:U6 snRNA-associated Sm-like protein LSm7 n=1 Tax=Python bivittatus TaxID=176946 RepID=A0A9F2RBF1_PYTBI|nr:U6 snRNA-associated Sm-like protein LSm7 [Python bivittatus]